TTSTRHAVWGGVVTTAGEAVIDPEFQPLPDDVSFCELHKRRVNLEPLGAFYAGPGRQVCHALEGFNELWTAIRVAAVVERIDSDEDVGGAQHLSPRKRKR